MNNRFIVLLLVLLIVLVGISLYMNRRKEGFTEMATGSGICSDDDDEKYVIFYPKHPDPNRRGKAIACNISQYDPDSNLFNLDGTGYIAVKLNALNEIRVTCKISRTLSSAEPNGNGPVLTGANWSLVATESNIVLNYLDKFISAVRGDSDLTRVDFSINNDNNKVTLKVNDSVPISKEDLDTDLVLNRFNIGKDDDTYFTGLLGDVVVTSESIVIPAPTAPSATAPSLTSPTPTTPTPTQTPSSTEKITLNSVEKEDVVDNLKNVWRDSSFDNLLDKLGGVTFDMVTYNNNIIKLKRILRIAKNTGFGEEFNNATAKTAANNIFSDSPVLRTWVDTHVDWTGLTCNDFCILLRRIREALEEEPFINYDRYKNYDDNDNRFEHFGNPSMTFNLTQMKAFFKDERKKASDEAKRDDVSRKDKIVNLIYKIFVGKIQSKVNLSAEWHCSDVNNCSEIIASGVKFHPIDEIKKSSTSWASQLNSDGLRKGLNKFMVPKEEAWSGQDPEHLGLVTKMNDLLKRYNETFNLGIYFSFLISIPGKDNESYSIEIIGVPSEDNGVSTTSAISTALCNFVPEGDDELNCIALCSNFNDGACETSECLDSCRECDDKLQCRWLQDSDQYSGAVTCEYNPYGDTRAKCVTNCRDNRYSYGGASCTVPRCANKCDTCTDYTKCLWLDRPAVTATASTTGIQYVTPNTGTDPSLVATEIPRTPLLSGIGGDNRISLYWTTRGSPTTKDVNVAKYLILVYKTNDHTSGVRVEVVIPSVKCTENSADGACSYTITDSTHIKNGEYYSVGVAAINEAGISVMSNIIVVQTKVSTKDMAPTEINTLVSEGALTLTRNQELINQIIKRLNVEYKTADTELQTLRNELKVQLPDRDKNIINRLDGRTIDLSFV